MKSLRSTPFRILTGSWYLTNLADSVLIIILAVWVKDLTGSDGAAGLVFAALGLPALVSPVLGHIADRVSRRRMIITAYVTGAVALLALLTVRDAGDVWVVFAVTIVYAGVGYATAAAQSGLIRDLLPDEALGAANGRLTTIDQSFKLAMPIAGAAVYALAGPLPLVLLAVASFLGAAALISRMRIQETPPTASHERASFLAEATAGFRHLTSTAPLGALTVGLAVGFAAIGVINGIAFAVIDRALGLPPEMLGPLTSAQAVTAVVAGLTAARMIRRFGAQSLVVVGLAITAIGTVPLMTSSLAAVIAGMGAVGLGVTWAIVGFMTERQARTPATLQGRVQAATMMIITVPQLVLTVMAAGVVGLLDHRVLVAITALGLLAAAAVASRRPPAPLAESRRPSSPAAADAGLAEPAIPGTIEP